MKKHLGWTGYCLGVIGVFLLSINIQAASLGVWPINPRIDAPASATMVWVRNNSANDDIVLQARVLKWSQHDNAEQYDAQDDLVVSPPLITVKPGTQQIFRVVNRKGVIASVTEEKSFRLIIDEIPVEGKKSQGPLNFQMRYSLPLFVGIPIAYADKNASHRLHAMADGLRYRLITQPQPAIEISNIGSFNARLSKVRINVEDASPIILSEGLLGYVLVGSTKSWPIDTKHLSAVQQKKITLIFEQDRQELEIAAQ